MFEQDSANVVRWAVQADDAVVPFWVFAAGARLLQDGNRHNVPTEIYYVKSSDSEAEFTYENVRNFRIFSSNQLRHVGVFINSVLITHSAFRNL